MNQLVLIDFDGTVTYSDTMFEFIKFTDGKIGLFLGVLLLSPILCCFKMGWVSADTAKLSLLNYFYKKKSKIELELLGKQFCEHHSFKKLIKQSALDKIRFYIENNCKVVIVTASVDLWVKPWANKVGVDCISTRLQYSEGIYAGEFDGKNCNGKEKVKGIKSVYCIERFEKIIAYGDTKGDKQMLDLADEAHFKYFD